MPCTSARCPPCGPLEPPVPYVTCCHVVPPPILAPTCPQTVKPLRLPEPCDPAPKLSAEEAWVQRYDNYYNNYNIDYHPEGPCAKPPYVELRIDKCYGVTVDGGNPCIPNRESYELKPYCPPPGCPTGFKPTTMIMHAPPACHPCGVWVAEVMKCLPKPFKNDRSKLNESF